MRVARPARDTPQSGGGPAVRISRVLSPVGPLRVLHHLNRLALIRSQVRTAEISQVIDPDDRTATMFRPKVAKITFASESDVLDLSDIIPGFRCHLREIFQ